jgi:hypothetical protein
MLSVIYATYVSQNMAFCCASLKLNVIMLSAVMQSVALLSVVMLNVVAPTATPRPKQDQRCLVIFFYKNLQNFDVGLT